MASPLEIYTAWQSRQTTGDFEHLGEVVDLEGFAISASASPTGQRSTRRLLRI
jgi:hypothetical protein